MLRGLQPSLSRLPAQQKCLTKLSSTRALAYRHGDHLTIKRPLLMLKNSTISIKQPSRCIYTDPIDPYPFNYVNEEKWPSRHLYRETWSDPPWKARDNKWYVWLSRAFWTYLFYSLYSDPGVILGHFHPPDPSTFTDEQLGIPPDEYGTYEEWLRNRMESAAELEQV